MRLIFLFILPPRGFWRFFMGGKYLLGGDNLYFQFNAGETLSASAKPEGTTDLHPWEFRGGASFPQRARREHPRRSVPPTQIMFFGLLRM